MTKIVIVLSPEGSLDSVLVNDDIDLDVLKRGQDDNKIDTAEATLTELNLS